MISARPSSAAAFGPEAMAMDDDSPAGDASAQPGLPSAPDSSADRTLTTPAAATVSDPGTALRSGVRVAAYTLVRPLGRGGMGVVYVAEQHNPRRMVALKLIRPGLTDPELLGRFAYEAQILGRLQHPGIAQIYEAGTTDTGDGPQPFFAMELVSGRPLAAFLADRQFGIRERVALFIRICAAVQHAHTKGVIHRDLKPGNILVSDDGQPKILDFGVARATGGDVQACTRYTTMGQLVGTVPYMSPEQIGGDPRELDTRSDVYALGVILYELLAGRLPYDLAHRPLPEIARIIREVAPLPLGAANRALRGDLELIAAHALEKDRGQRYQSAADLAADLQRYLDDEAVVARPPSAWYRARKFARRRRALVVSAAVVALAVLGGLVATSAALARALRAERTANTRLAESLAARRAEAAQRRIAEQARARAELEAETAAAVNAFLNDMLASVDPAEGDREITVREVLDRAAEGISGALPGRPLVEAAVRRTIGRSYLGLGLYEQALAQLEAALAIRTRCLDGDAPEVLASLSDVATALQNLSRLDEAQTQFERALDLHTQVYGEMHVETLAARNNLGLLLVLRGRYAEAEPHFRAALAGHERVSGPESLETLDALSNLAALLEYQGRLDEAEPLARASLDARRRAFGPRHPGTLVAINNLGTLLAAADRLDEAEPLYKEGLELSRQVLGAEHPETLISMANMAGLLRDRRKFDDAEALYRETLAIRRRLLGPAHLDTIASLRDLGLTVRDLGRLDEAATLLEEAVAAARENLGADAPDTVAAVHALGTVRLLQGRAADAEPLLREAFEHTRQRIGADAWKTGVYQAAYGEALAAAARPAEAAEQLRAAYSVFVAALGPQHPHALRTAGLLADTCAALKDPEAAVWQARAAPAATEPP